MIAALSSCFVLICTGTIVDIFDIYIHSATIKQPTIDGSSVAKQELAIVQKSEPEAADVTSKSESSSLSRHEEIVHTLSSLRKGTSPAVFDNFWNRGQKEAYSFI